MSRFLCVSLGLLCCFLSVTGLPAQSRLEGSAGGSGKSYLLQGSATQSTVAYGASSGYRLYVGSLHLADSPAMEEMTPSGESSPPLPGARFSLEQNYPNPFNPSTTITYSLPQSGHCRLVIYDVRGRLVRVLADREMGAGRYCVLWDGRDEAGRPVGSGVYLYKLTAGEKQEIRRMVLLK